MAMFSFKCKDVGMDCGFEVKDADKNSLLMKIADHAKTAHGMAEIPPDLKDKVVAAIKSE